MTDDTNHEEGLPEVDLVALDLVALEQDACPELDTIVPTRCYQTTPLVGLGGSAGSITALQTFFELMPSDSGMGFVVILHLSPEHESFWRSCCNG